MITDQQISLTCDTCHTLAGVFATHAGLAAWATRHGWDGDTCPTCLMDSDAADRIPARCPKRYTTLRNAKSAAYIAATRRSEKPLPPVRCDACGDWHLAAATTTDTTATTTPTGATT